MIRSVASPLRYPGGKSCLYDLTSSILRANDLHRGHYVEPYAGGCGLALSLLYGGNVSDIYVNDVDPAIWSFWKAVLDSTDEFLELLDKTPVTLAEREKQKNVYAARNRKDTVRLGFATFFLNRTNRSGVIKGAGVIGGLEQSGPYKIDCRFNKEELSRRILRTAKYREQIHLSNQDAVVFMKRMDKKLPGRSFFCIDPPYFSKGSSLYTDFYGHSEHETVAASVMKLDRPWIVTYDYHEEIKRIYKRRKQYMLSLNYSVQTKRVGSELLIASKGLKIPVDMLTQNEEEPLPRVLTSPLPSLFSSAQMSA